MRKLKRRKIKKIAREIVEEVRKKKRKKERVEFLDTGAVPLNLALSSKARGGIARGRVINIVGDGSSGKTLLALEFAFNCLKNVKKIKSKIFPKVKKVRIVYDNGEGVMDFPVEDMYGEKFERAVKWKRSSSVEAWGRSVGRELDRWEPGVFTLYIIDSLDSLPPEKSKERFKKAALEDKPEESKAYAEKASYLSQNFWGNLCSDVMGKDFTLIIISQVREKIGVIFGEKYYRAGGKGMDFYTHQVFWLAVLKRLTSKISVKGVQRVYQYGVNIKARQKRSKVSKPYSEGEFIILYDHGVDRIGSLVNFLYSGKKIKHKRKEYTKEKFIQYLEDHPEEYELLVDKAQEIWDEAEEKIKPKRKPKY